MERSSETDLLLGPAEAADRRSCYDVRQGRWFTYGDLREAVSSCAALLHFPRKALVFCFCDNSIESLTAYLACWSAGHAVLLLDPRLDVSFVARLCSVYRPDFLIAPQPTTVLADQLAIPPYENISSAGPLIRRASKPAEHQLDAHLAVLLSTSGSTGSPKLVRLSRGNVISNALQIDEALAIDPGERAITTLPPYYSYGLSVINSHLAAGASLVLTNEGLLSNVFWSAFRETACTSVAAIPYMYQMLQRLDLQTLNVPTLKTMTQAGGKLPSDLITYFHAFMVRRLGRFFVMYGQTEATARIAVLPVDALPEKLGSVGRPVRYGSLVIESNEGVVNAPFVEGELVYSGPNVMQGYATAPEDLSRGPELKGQLHTGDLGYRDQDGYFYITGRNKRFCKLLGLRINLDEVEDLIKSRGPTAVLPGPERLLIYCEYGDDREFGKYARLLGEKLNLHPSLFTFRRVDSIPLNSNGKPDYQTLART